MGCMVMVYSDGSLAVHPGAVATEMQQQWEDSYPGITGTIAKYMTLASSRSPEQGSFSALYAACSDEVVEKDYNGVYLSDPVSVVVHVLRSGLTRHRESSAASRRRGRT